METLYNTSDEEISAKCIECACGFKIDLSCDANQMGNAIAAHAQEHVKPKSDIASAKAQASRIEYLLIEKVFIAINLIPQVFIF